MRVRFDDQSEAHRNVELEDAYLDCQETVQRIWNETPLLLRGTSLDSRRVSRLQRAANDVVDRWLDVMECVDQITKEHGGVLFFPDLKQSEWRVIMARVTMVNFLIDDYRRICGECGLSF